MHVRGRVRSGQAEETFNRNSLLMWSAQAEQLAHDDGGCSLQNGLPNPSSGRFHRFIAPVSSESNASQMV
ncbi:hypothetical protein PoB_002658800 [Plakobranchus ocellatus]|uniref:Uncharacterized protein n=1 Tax=Plakobranchus ocellatus TaxID=259542 RepID=A0AAV3ZYX3_9GAST|nr:hypothetical protein PoB_002658800 [Plakobranchus ocellatus]